MQYPLVDSISRVHCPDGRRVRRAQTAALHRHYIGAPHRSRLFTAGRPIRPRHAANDSAGVR